MVPVSHPEIRALIVMCRESVIDNGRLDDSDMEILTRALNLYAALYGAQPHVFDAYTDDGNDVVDVGQLSESLSALSRSGFTMHDLMEKLYPDGRVFSKWRTERYLATLLRRLGYQKKQRQRNGRRRVYWFRV